MVMLKNNYMYSIAVFLLFLRLVHGFIGVTRWYRYCERGGGVPPQKCLKNHTILAKVDKIWVIVTRQLAVPPAL